MKRIPSLSLTGFCPLFCFPVLVLVVMPHGLCPIIGSPDPSFLACMLPFHNGIALMVADVHPLIGNPCRVSNKPTTLRIHGSASFVLSLIPLILNFYLLCYTKHHRNNNYLAPICIEVNPQTSTVRLAVILEFHPLQNQQLVWFMFLRCGYLPSWTGGFGGGD